MASAGIYPNLITAIPLEKGYNTVENALSHAAVIPGVGLIKMALGTLQLVSAVALLIFVTCLQNDYLQEAAILQVKHGAGNMLAGFVEAIPLAGIIGLVIRYVRLSNSYSNPNPNAEAGSPFIADPETFKFMPYESVQKANFYPHVAGTGVSETINNKYYKELNKHTLHPSVDVIPVERYKELCEQFLVAAVKEAETPYIS